MGAVLLFLCSSAPLFCYCPVLKLNVYWVIGHMACKTFSFYLICSIKYSLYHYEICCYFTSMSELNIVDAQSPRFRNDPFSKGFFCYAERSGLQELNLEDCRAYLRKHGLRITGTKAECIQRIMEHWWSVATSHIKLLAHLLC